MFDRPVGNITHTLPALPAHPRRYNVSVHYVYIVRCADDTFYTGYARDPEARAKAHNRGRGARYTAGRRPVCLVYAERFERLGDALRREHQLKRLKRRQKQALIASGSSPGLT